MAHAAGQLDLVLFEFHPGTAAIAQSPSGKIDRDVCCRYLDTRRQPLHDRYQSRAMGFTSSHPTQHNVILSDRLREPDGTTVRMATMIRQSAWIFDPVTLRDVATDPKKLAAQLHSALPEDRIWQLRMLGRLDEALAEGTALLAAASGASDPWPILISVAEVYRWRENWAAAEDLQQQAWSLAVTPDRQATTLQQMGKRCFDLADYDGAARFFDLAAVLRPESADPEHVESDQLALTRAREVAGFDAVIAAGGAAQRFDGADKPAQNLAGWPLLEHVLLAASAASSRIVVGPHRPIILSPTWQDDHTPDKGPAAAIAAAADHLNQPVTLVLAADMPFIALALPRLRAALAARPKADVAVLIDADGHLHYLAAAWRTPALLAVIAKLGGPAGAANISVRALYQDARIMTVVDHGSWSLDCDTFGDLADADTQLRRDSADLQPATLLAWPGLERPVLS
jgi:molybdopterin-guanine dinucleotide biosynthesis protein A